MPTILAVVVAWCAFVLVNAALVFAAIALTVIAYTSRGMDLLRG